MKIQLCKSRRVFYLCYPNKRINAVNPTMKLFDLIFGLPPKAKNVIDGLPSYWDDYYCQIEIVSVKNIEHIKTTIREIQEFSERRSTEFGITDVYIRKGLPYPTVGQKIRIDHFEKLLAEWHFGKAKQIRSNGTVIDCTNATANAFSLPCFNIFYNCEDGLIKNIWTSSSLIVSTDHFGKILEALHALGKTFDLVLIDWHRCELIDLKDKAQITEHLMWDWK